MIYLVVFLLTILQNTTFSLVSRARNRDNQRYHIFASILSNSVWFATMSYIVKNDFTIDLMIPYTLGAVIGSVYGSSLSMKIESWLGATADGHIKK